MKKLQKEFFVILRAASMKLKSEIPLRHGDIRNCEQNNLMVSESISVSPPPNAINGIPDLREERKNYSVPINANGVLNLFAGQRMLILNGISTNPCHDDDPASLKVLSKNSCFNGPMMPSVVVISQQQAAKKRRKMMLGELKKKERATTRVAFKDLA